MAETASQQVQNESVTKFIDVHWHTHVEEMNHYCIEGEITNVNIKGALLECDETISVNSKIKLLIDAELDDGCHQLQCLALVKKQLCKQNKHFLCLKFLSMPLDDKVALHKFAAHH